MSDLPGIISRIGAEAGISRYGPRKGGINIKVPYGESVVLSIPVEAVAGGGLVSRAAMIHLTRNFLIYERPGKDPQINLLFDDVEGEKVTKRNAAGLKTTNMLLKIKDKGQFTISFKKDVSVDDMIALLNEFKAGTGEKQAGDDFGAAGSDSSSEDDSDDESSLSDEEDLAMSMDMDLMAPATRAAPKEDKGFLPLPVLAGILGAIFLLFIIAISLNAVANKRQAKVLSLKAHVITFDREQDGSTANVEVTARATLDSVKRLEKERMERLARQEMEVKEKKKHSGTVQRGKDAEAAHMKKMVDGYVLQKLGKNLFQQVQLVGWESYDPRVLALMELDLSSDGYRAALKELKAALEGTREEKEEEGDDDDGDEDDQTSEESGQDEVPEESGEDESGQELDEDGEEVAEELEEEATEYAEDGHDDEPQGAFEDEEESRLEEEVEGSVSDAEATEKAPTLNFRMREVSRHARDRQSTRWATPARDKLKAKQEKFITIEENMVKEANAKKTKAKAAEASSQAEEERASVKAVDWGKREKKKPRKLRL